MAATRQDAAIIILPDRGPGIYTPPPRSSADSNDGEPGLDRERQRRASARAKQQRKPGCGGALRGAGAALRGGKGTRRAVGATRCAWGAERPEARNGGRP